MDQELLSYIDAAEAQKSSAKQTIRFLDDSTGEIEVIGSDEPVAKRHVLKPLEVLYGGGTGRGSLDPTDETFTPLLMSIEEPIVQWYRAQPRVTDAQVTIALDRLCSCPESDPGSDVLARRIQLNVRLHLSLNDYSRQDLRLALRKVAKSVVRHTKESGPRGYLMFLDEVLVG